MSAVTARPWSVTTSRTGPRGAYYPPFVHGYPHGSVIAPIQSDRGRGFDPGADAAFIVYAVNNIEATEARMAEAERLLLGVRYAVLDSVNSEPMEWSRVEKHQRLIDAFLAQPDAPEAT